MRQTQANHCPRAGSQRPQPLGHPVAEPIEVAIAEMLAFEPGSNGLGGLFSLSREEAVDAVVSAMFLGRSIPFFEELMPF